MLRILCLSGPSRSGKSTLARRLSETLKLPYLKFPPSIKHGMKLDDPQIDVSSRLICDCIEEVAMHFDFVLDRAWPDNIVYGRLFNRHIDESYYFSRMASLGERLHVIYVTADQEALLSRMSEHDKKSSVYTAIAENVLLQLKIWNDVVSLMKQVGIKVYTIDNSKSIDDAYSDLCDKLSKVMFDLTNRSQKSLYIPGI